MVYFRKGLTSEIMGEISEMIMYDYRTHSIFDRIVSVSQPFVRPIVRGKADAPVEFGAKLDISVTDGWTRLEALLTHIQKLEICGELWSVLLTGRDIIPNGSLQTKFTGTGGNLSFCKERGIRFSGPALGRPKKDAVRDKRQDCLDE